MGSCWSMQVQSSNPPRSAQTTSDSRKQHNHENNNNNNRSQKKIISNEKWALPTPEDGVGGSGSGGGGGGNIQQLPPSGHIVTPNLKMFRFAELKEATRNFQPHTMLGEGGFGRVFKGWANPNTLAPAKVGGGIPVAVKRSKPDSAQGLKEWQAEVKFLGKFSHPNLVKLLGYCWENEEFLLVYEYMQKGSLENHLFRREETLPWDTRMKIAVGAARGLKFLHTTEKTVIYRDFKSANILLDGEFNPKLSDFGLAKLGPANGESHISTGIVGTYGYAAPEYVATGHLYVKSDVFGFGVVLLEIITGLRVLDNNRPNGERNLVDWTRPILLDKRKLKTMVDPRLEDDYPSKGVLKAAELIRRCLEPDPKNRPSMEEVLLELELINAMKMKPKETKINRGRSVGHMHGQKLGENGRVSLRSPSTTSY